MLFVISEIRTIHGELQGTREFHEPEASTGNEFVAEAVPTLNEPGRTIVTSTTVIRNNAVSLRTGLLRNGDKAPLAIMSSEN